MNAPTAGKTQALVVADDPVYLNWLQNAAGGAAEFSLLRPLDAEDLLARVQAAGTVGIVFFHLATDSLERRLSWMERLIERWPDLPVVGVGNDSALVLPAMRAGARDFFALERDAAAVAVQISKLMRRSAAGGQRSGPRQGRLFAVVVSDGHESAAFTAGHLALASRDLSGDAARSLVVDLASPCGAASILFNLSPTYSVLDAVADAYRCDPTLVDTAFPKSGNGLYVLSQPEDQTARPSLNPEELLKLLDVVRSLFAATVVTLDSSLPLSALSGVIAQADRTLLMCDQSVIRSRRAKHLLRALRLENCPLDRAGLVVDPYRRRIGLEPENLAELLDLPLLAALGGDPLTRLHAMNAGEPLFAFAPKDDYCAGMRRLAQLLCNGKASEAPGLMERLFG
ncbi:MAG: hypothetical protein AABY95_09645 [Pseudomonadota bacterium]